MIVFTEISGITYRADLSKGTDISLGFGPGGNNPNAFGIPPADIQPIRVGDFVGSVAKGSGANCDVIQFCAHGNGTHTECVGHISVAHESVNQCIRKYFFSAHLISIPLHTLANGDQVISAEDLRQVPLIPADAIVIRTLPNPVSKKKKIWSGKNPPYFQQEAMQILREAGFKHLLTDLPSVDREEDDGVLAAHHIWWNYPEKPRKDASITELIYVPEKIKDGLYFLNLQFAAVESDASPCRPVLFPLKEV